MTLKDTLKCALLILTVNYEKKKYYETIVATCLFCCFLLYLSVLRNELTLHALISNPSLLLLS